MKKVAQRAWVLTDNLAMRASEHSTGAHLAAVRRRLDTRTVADVARPSAISWPTVASMAASGASRLGWLISSPKQLNLPAAQYGGAPASTRHTRCRISQGLNVPDVSALTMSPPRDADPSAVLRSHEARVHSRHCQEPSMQGLRMQG